MNKKPKLLHVISSVKIGGAESLLIDLLHALGNQDYEHHVIFFHDGPNRHRITQLGVSVYHITGVVCLYDPMFWWRLYRCIKKIQPDMIHSHLWAANFAARLISWFMKIPLVSTLHLGVNQDGKIRNMLDAYTFRLSGPFVAVSHAVKQSVHDKKKWVPAAHVQVIPNGIDHKNVLKLALQQQVSRASLGFEDEHIIIGSIGRFIARKNFLALLHAFADLHKEIPQSRLLLLGLGPQEAALREKANQLGIAPFVQFVIGKPAYGYLPLMDMFVLASHQEGLSIALLEAMSCGVPCIVAENPGVHEIIDHQVNGYVVERADADGLKEALQTMAVDQEARAVYGKNGQEMVERQYAIRSMAERYRHVYRNVLKI